MAGTPLDRSHDVPLYQQLYAVLRGKVQRGEWPPASMIPPESELMADYGVSRITVRSALDQLVRDGLIERQRGRGSFVRAATPEARACVTSLTEAVIRWGRTPTTDVLGVEVRPAWVFGEALPFDPEERVARVERVRRIDGTPVALMRSFLPERHVPGICKQDFAEEGPAQSLLHVLEHRFGIVLDVGEETLVPTGAHDRDAGPLGIDPGTPVAVKVCRIENAAGETTLFEHAIWCAPQTQPIQRLPDGTAADRHAGEYTPEGA